MLRLEWRVPAWKVYRQTTQIIRNAQKDMEEEVEALCQSAVRDGAFRQMFTDQLMLHMKGGLQSSSVGIREGVSYNNQW